MLHVNHGTVRQRRRRPRCRVLYEYMLVALIWNVPGTYRLRPRHPNNKAETPATENEELNLALFPSALVVSGYPHCRSICTCSPYSCQPKNHWSHLDDRLTHSGSAVYEGTMALGAVVPGLGKVHSRLVSLDLVRPRSFAGRNVRKGQTSRLTPFSLRMSPARCNTLRWDLSRIAYAS
jgi:hypothetical protein